MSNLTLAIIKPDAVKKGTAGKIYDRITSAGFKILGAKLIKMSLAQAQGFYAIHEGKPFYKELTKFMSSSQSMVLALKKEMLFQPGGKPLALQTLKMLQKEQSAMILPQV